MATALRIQQLTGGSPVQNIDFEEYEVTKIQVRPYHPSRIERAQTGKPTLLMFGNSRAVISVGFRIHGEVTPGKLTTLRNLAKTTGQQFRVFPKYIDDNSNSYDCLVSPLIPLYWLFSGMYESGKIYQLAFKEIG